MDHIKKVPAPSKTDWCLVLKGVAGNGRPQLRIILAFPSYARNAFFEKMTDDDVTGSEFIGVGFVSLLYVMSFQFWRLVNYQSVA